MLAWCPSFSRPHTENNINFQWLAGIISEWRFPKSVTSLREGFETTVEYIMVARTLALCLLPAWALGQSNVKCEYHIEPN